MKRKVIVLLLCVCLVSIAQAQLTITNGTFERGDAPQTNIRDWYDHITGAWYNTTSYPGTPPNPFPSSAVMLGNATGNRWLYQAIGTKVDGVNYTLSFDYAQPTDGNANRSVAIRVDIYQGAYPAAADGTNLTGLTLIYSVETPRVSDNTTIHPFSTVLDLSSANTTDQLWLRFTNLAGTGTDTGSWVVMDNVVLTAEPFGPYSPVVLPDNGDGTVGDLISLTQASVTLNWKAPNDPNTVTAYPVDPDVIGYNIYLDDAFLGYVSQVHNADPSQTNPDNSYGPFDLDRAATYDWQIEAVMDSGAVTNYPELGDTGYPAGDPGNLLGPLWSFTTTSGAPKFLTLSDHQLTDSSGNASLAVEADTLASHYRWFKVVGVQDSEGGESDDIPLTDGPMYSGTTTDTLSITGMSADGSDDARYYVIAYNQGIASVPSAVRWVWYPRLVSHYMFDLLSYYTNDQGSFIKDMISGYDAQLMSGNGSAVPYLAPDAPSGLGRVTSLPFNAGNQIYLQVNAPFAATFKDLTISMWFKTTGTAGTSSYQRLFDYGNGQGNSTFISPNYNGAGRAAFAVDVPDHGERNVQSALGLVQNNTWTHITATLSGTTARLFINGEWVNLSTDFPYPPVMNGATTQNYIGRSQYPDPYFNGNIADLKVWNYALTNEEVAREYLDGVPSKDYICDREEFRHFQSMDSNNNCIIDLEDLAELVGMWMDYQLFFAAD